MGSCNALCGNAQQAKSNIAQFAQTNIKVSNKNLAQQKKAFSQRFYSIRQVQPFFSGQILGNRMDKIRKQFIEPIRANYSKQMFNQYMKIFNDDLIEKDSQNKNLLSDIQYSYWTDQIRQDKNFNLIKLTTNQRCNKYLTGIINKILRQTVQDQKLMKIGVFLIEAINIQLFLLTKTRKKLDNFTGKVYRGIVCSQSDLKKFLQIEKEPLQKRFISVPLSLSSSTKDLQVAKHFIEVRKDMGNCSLIFQIDVIQLDPEQLNIYKQTFPTSVVSTICAVDISASDLSQYVQEKQVLLRGAFMNILKIEFVKQVRNGKPFNYHLVYCVMVNANRDHISTNHLGDKAQQARNMFAAMAKQARYAHAYNFLKNSQFKEGKTQEDSKHQEQFQSFAERQTKNLGEINKRTIMYRNAIKNSENQKIQSEAIKAQAIKSVKNFQGLRQKPNKT